MNSAINTSYTCLDFERATSSIGDSEVIKELLLMLSDLLEKDIVELDACMEKSDMQTVRNILHRLNGSLGHFVHENLSLLSKDLEIHASQNELGIVQKHYPRLKTAFISLRNEIAATYA